MHALRTYLFKISWRINQFKSKNGFIRLKTKLPADIRRLHIIVPNRSTILGYDGAQPTFCNLIDKIKIVKPAMAMALVNSFFSFDQFVSHKVQLAKHIL